MRRGLLDKRSFRLSFVRFYAEAGVDEVTVAVDVVDAGDGGPELAVAYPVGGESGRFS